MSGLEGGEIAIVVVPPRPARQRPPGAQRRGGQRATRWCPLFVLDERLLGEPRAAPARSWFVLRSLAELSTPRCATRGSGLLLRVGRPEDVVARGGPRGPAPRSCWRRATSRPSATTRRRPWPLRSSGTAVACGCSPACCWPSPSPCSPPRAGRTASSRPFWRALRRPPTLGHCSAAIAVVRTTGGSWTTSRQQLSSRSRLSPRHRVPGCLRRARPPRRSASGPGVRDGLPRYGDRPRRPRRPGHLAPGRGPPPRHALAAAGRDRRARGSASRPSRSCDSSPGGSSTTTCSSIDARPLDRAADETLHGRLPLTRPTTPRPSRPGARAAPASRSWMPGCVSWQRRRGWAIGPAWWWPPS